MPKLKPVKIIIAGEDRFSKKFGAQFKSIKKFGNGLNAAGRKMTMGLTAPILGAGIAMARTSALFESGLNKVEALTGASTEQMSMLSASAKDLGLQTKFSATEAADAMAFLGMAGWEVNEILAGTPALLDLAAASSTELGRAADITSNIMGAFGLEAKDVSHIADVLAATTSSSNVDMEMLAETMKYAGPIAKKFGASLEDTAAAAGLLGNIGIQGSTAGTMLRTAFTNLAAPVSEGSKALERMGINVTNNLGNMRDFKDIMKDLASELPKMSNSKQIDILKDIFGKKAISGAAGLVDNIASGKKGFLSLAKALENVQGRAKAMATIMNKGAVGAFQKFKASLEGLSIAFGESGLLDVITKVLDGLTSFFQKMAKLSPTTLKAIMIVGAFVAALGPLFMILGSIISSVGSLMLILGAVGGVMAVVTSPITLVAAALTALGIGVASVVAIQMEAASDIGEMYNELANNSVLLQEQPGLIMRSWDKIAPYFKLLNNEMLGAFDGLGSQIGKIFDGFYANNIQPILDGIESWVDTLIKGLAFFARLGNTKEELYAAGLNAEGYPVIDDRGASQEEMRSGLINPGKQESLTKIVFENLPSGAEVIQEYGSNVEINKGPMQIGYSF